MNNAEADSIGLTNLKIDYVHSGVGVCKGQHECPEDC